MARTETNRKLPDDVAITAMRLCIEADLRREFPFALGVEQNYVEHLAMMVLEERLTKHEAIVELERAHGVRVHEMELEQLAAENKAKIKFMSEIMALSPLPPIVIPSLPRSAEIQEMLNHEARAVDVFPEQSPTHVTLTTNGSNGFVPLPQVPALDMLESMFDQAIAAVGVPKRKEESAKPIPEPALACSGKKRLIQVQE